MSTLNSSDVLASRLWHAVSMAVMYYPWDGVWIIILTDYYTGTLVTHKAVRRFKFTVYSPRGPAYVGPVKTRCIHQNKLEVQEKIPLNQD